MGYYKPVFFGEDTTTYGFEYDREIFENYGLGGNGGDQQNQDNQNNDS